MWGQLKGDSSESKESGLSSTGATRDGSGQGGSSSTPRREQYGDDDPTARRGIGLPLPTSQPDPMMTPASPAGRQAPTGSTGRYADYLAEVAGTSDVATPGKSPQILSAPTYDDDDDDEEEEDLVGVGTAGSNVMMRDDSGHLGSGEDSNGGDGDDSVARTIDVTPVSPAAEFTAGSPPPPRPPVGISGLTTASSVSGITELASGMGSSTSGVDDSPDDTSPDEEEVEEVIVSSDSAEDTSASPEAADEAVTPVPLMRQQEGSKPLPPTSAPQYRAPLSPFSPDGRRARTEIQLRRQQRLLGGGDDDQWSLLPCRKVSVLVRVKPPGAKWDFEEASVGGGRSKSASKHHRHGASSAEDDKAASVQLGVFPLLPPGVAATPADSDDAPATGLLSLASTLSSSSSSGASQTANSLVVVNPTAFGTRIPSDLTMETARLVAEVGNIDSEDWARRYRFDDVLWPDVGGSSSVVGAGRSDGTLVASARAMVSDALGLTTRAGAATGTSSVLCTLGSSGSGRSYTAFGRAAIRHVSGRRRSAPTQSSIEESNRTAVLDRTGVIGLLVAELLDFSSRSKPVEFSVSLLEVVDDDVLRDLFRLSNAEFDPGQPRLRHPDHHGAVVQNLTEMSFGSLKELEAALSERLISSPSVSASTVSRGHTVATIKVTRSSSRSKSGKHTLIQVVDLNPGDDPDSDAVAAPSSSVSDGVQKRRAASVRKSLSGLRGILRGLIVQEAQRSTSQNLSYRECTLTKLLQRTLDSIDSRAVLIACIDPRKDSYHRTVQTLNFVNRLWIKPGLTAQSPFEARVKGVQVGISSRKSTQRTLFPDLGEGGDTDLDSKGKGEESSDALVERLRSSTDRSAVLTSLVSDPRQRVATLLASSSKPICHGPGDDAKSATPSTVEPVRVAPPSSAAKKAGGTFDSVLAKLDALESTPTYERQDSRSSAEDASPSVVSSTNATEGSTETDALIKRLVAFDRQSERAQRQLEEVRAESLAAIKERGSRHGSHATSSSSSEAQLMSELRAARGALEDYKLASQSDKSLQEERLSAPEKELDGLKSSEAQLSSDDAQKIRSLGQQVKESKYAEHQANEESRRLRGSSSSQTSSSDTALLLAEREAGREESKKEIDSLKRELEHGRTAKKEARDESDKGKALLEEKLRALRVELERSKEGGADSLRLRAKEEENSRIGERERALLNELNSLRIYSNQIMSGNVQEQRRLNDLIDKLQIEVADEKVKTEKYREEAKQASSSSGSHTTSSSEAELMAQIEELQREQRERGILREEEIKASDDAITHMKEQLILAKDQAKIAFDAKVLAEDELGLLQSSSSSSTTSGSAAKSKESASDELKKRQINQLKAEKKLMQQMAVSMKRRLETDKEGLRRRLETVQEEADTTRYRQGLAEGELEKVHVESSSTRSSNEAGLQRENEALRMEKDVIAEELKRLKDSSSESHTSSSEADLISQVERLQQQLSEEKMENTDKLKTMREKLAEMQYAQHVAKEDARLLRESSSSHTSSSEAELAGQLKATRDAFEDHKIDADKERKQLEHDKSALKTRLATLINQDIRTSDDVIDALRAELRESYEKAKAREDEREEYLQRLSALKEELEEAQYAEHVAKEDARLLRESSSSQTSSSEAELAGQLKVTRDAFEDHKVEASRQKRQLEHDKIALKARLQALVGEVKSLSKARDDAAAERKEEIRTSNSLKAHQDNRIVSLLAEIEDMAYIKALTDEELKRLKGSSSGSQSIGDDPDLFSQIDALRREKRERATEVTEETRIAEKAMAEFKAQLDTSYKVLKDKVKQRGDEVKSSDDALALMKSQLENAYERARLKTRDTDAKMAEMDTKIAMLNSDIEDATYGKHLAEEELKKAKGSSSGSQSSSSEAALVAQVDALKREKLELAARRAEEIRISDAAMADVKAELEAACEAARGKAKEGDDESIASDDALDLMKSQLDVAYEKARAKAAQREAEIKASDYAIADIKDQLDIARGQAKLAFDAKVLAEDELRAKSSTSTSSSSTDSLLIRQIYQLQAEKKLTQQMAAAMKKRLEGRSRDLHKRLDTLQEEVNEAQFRQVAAAQEATKARSSRSSRSSSSQQSSDKEEQLQRELDVLRAEKKVSDDDANIKQQEYKAKVDALEVEVRAEKYAKLVAEGELKQIRDSSRSSTTGNGSESDMVKNLQKQLNELRAREVVAADEKQAVGRRLEWEKASKIEMMTKLEDMERRMRTATKEKDLAEKALDKLESSDISAVSEVDAVADALRVRIKELEGERKATMRNFRALEKKVAAGQLNVQDEMNYLRNTQINSLVQEIESLEKTIEKLTSENKELQKASQAFEKDQDLHKRLVEEGFLSSSMSDGSKSPHLEDQVKSLTSQIEVLKHRLTQALRGEEQSKAAEKNEREEVLDLQARMDKTLMQLQSLKSSSRTSMDRMKKEHAIALEEAKADAAEKDEEIASLRQRLQEAEADNRSLNKSGGQSATTDEVSRLERKNKKYLAKIEELQKRLGSVDQSSSVGEVSLLERKVEELQKDLSTTRRSLIDNQENTMDIMSQYEAIRLAKEETDHLLHQSQARTTELEQCIQSMKTKNDIVLSQSKKEAMSAEERLQKRIYVTEHAHAERISLLERQIQDLLKEREELQQKNEDFVKQLAREKHKRHQDDVEVKKKAEALQGEVSAATEELATMKTRAFAAKEEKNKMEEHLRKKNSTLKEEQTAMKGEIRRLKEQVSTLETEHRALKEHASLIEAENRELKERLFKTDDAMEATEAENRGLKDQIESMCKQLQVTRTEASEFQRENKEDAIAKTKLKRENATLKSSIKQCDEAMEAMHKEVTELKSTADVAMARLEAKKESSERRLKQDVQQLERELAAARVEANSARAEASAAERERQETERTMRGAVGDLEEQLHKASQRLQDMLMDRQETDERLRAVLEDNDSLKQENALLRESTHKLEASRGKPMGSVNRDIFQNDDEATSEQLEQERALRVKAEEIALALARRAKSGLSDNLEFELRYLMAADEDVGARALVAGRRQEEEDSALSFSAGHNQAMEELDKLRPVVSNLESLYEMKDRSVRDLQSSLSSTTSELKKYKSLALKLQARVDESKPSAQRQEEAESTPYRSRAYGSTGVASPWKRDDFKS